MTAVFSRNFFNRQVYNEVNNENTCDSASQDRNRDRAADIGIFG